MKAAKILDPYFAAEDWTAASIWPAIVAAYEADGSLLGRLLSNPWEAAG